jgi:hypothetical protein
MREVQCRAIIERANGVIVPSVNPGLCETCMHVQIVRSSKGSSFVLCRLSEVNPAFRRYPALPVITCRGYERGPESPRYASVSHRPSTATFRAAFAPIA